MSSLKRSLWTRSWLNTFTQQDASLSHQDIDAGYDVLDFDDTAASDLGVESLSEGSHQTEPSRLQPDISTNSLQLLELPADCFLPLSQSLIWHEYGNDDTDTRHGDENDANDLNGLIDRQEVADYELCGRRSDNTFRDLRSAARSRKRRRRERNKYYDWKRVKPDWLGAQVHNICELSPDGCYCFNNLEPSRNDKLITVTKQMMFEEAKWYPRPPTYHRSTHKPYLRLAHSWSRLDRQKEDAKHAHLRLYEDYYADRHYREVYGVDRGPGETRVILCDWWSYYEPKVDEAEDEQCDAPKHIWTKPKVDSRDERHAGPKDSECRGQVAPKTAFVSWQHASRDGRVRRAGRKHNKLAHRDLMNDLDDWWYMDAVDEYLEVCVLPYVFREDAWEFGVVGS